MYDLYRDDSETVRANHTPAERHQLHEILGREQGSDGGPHVPIAVSKTNGDQWLEKDPAAIVILDQIAAACAERDAELVKYQKAEPIARRASSTAHSHWQRIRQANDRALKLRETLETLKKVPK